MLLTCGAPGGASDRVHMSSKIEHFVVLLMENHAADHMFGCMDLPGYDGIKPGHSLPKDPSDPLRGTINVTCTGTEYVCQNLSGYDTFASKFGGNGSNPHRYPYSPQHDHNSALHGAQGAAVQLFAPDQLPIKTTLARNYGVFNKLYTAVPAASNPNHLFIQSATSCGLTSNGLYDDCGGASVTFPQRTIYDNMRDHNVSFGWYVSCASKTIIDWLVVRLWLYQTRMSRGNHVPDCVRSVGQVHEYNVWPRRSSVHGASTPAVLHPGPGRGHARRRSLQRSLLFAGVVLRAGSEWQPASIRLVQPSVPSIGSPMSGCCKGGTPVGRPIVAAHLTTNSRDFGCPCECRRGSSRMSTRRCEPVPSGSRRCCLWLVSSDARSSLLSRSILSLNSD